MKYVSAGNSFALKSEFLETYVDEMVGVINLKDKAFEISTDLYLKKTFFDKIQQVKLIPEIEVLLITSAESAMGEEKHAQFIKNIFESFDGEKYLFREEHALSQFIQLICGIEKMVISCVRGSVVGAFLGAILATDYRIVSEGTLFSFPHIRYEMPPQGALTFFLSKHLGIAKAKKILLSGEPLTAHEAYELGLIDEIVKEDNFEQNCLEVVKKMSKVPPSVVGMTKQLLKCDLKGLSAYFEMEAKMATKYRIKMPSENKTE